MASIRLLPGTNKHRQRRILPSCRPDTMKHFALPILILALLGCHHRTTAQANYLPEYKKYQQRVTAGINTLDKTIADSTRIILDRYRQSIELYSCTTCITEGPVFMPVAAFTLRHPETLLFVLQSALQGTRLSWTFRALFKKLYPAEYKELLAGANIVLLSDHEVRTEEQRWQNQVNEQRLSFTRLTEKYLQIIP
jgi:hypothetical protein